MRALRRLAGLVVVIALAGAALLTLPAVGRISASALEASLTRAIPQSGALGGGCHRGARGAYRCGVPDSQSSGEGVYLVRLRGRRCWRARKLTSEREGTPLPRRAEGCVGLRDQVRLWDRLLPGVLTGPAPGA